MSDARLGFLFDEETSGWIQALAEYSNKTPHEFMTNAVKVMVNAYLKDDDNG